MTGNQAVETSPGKRMSAHTEAQDDSSVVSPDEDVVARSRILSPVFDAARVVSLQRTVGNRAMAALLHGRDSPRPGIQRKFTGELEGLSDDQIVEKLTQAGFVVGTLAKTKLGNLRKQDGEFPSVDSLVVELKLRKSTGGTTPSVPETPIETPSTSFTGLLKPSKPRDLSVEQPKSTTSEQTPSVPFRLSPPKKTSGQSSLPPSKAPVFGGDLTGKNDEELAQLLTSAGFTVTRAVKQKIRELRTLDKSFDTVDALAKGLGLKKSGEPEPTGVGIGGKTTWTRLSSVGDVSATASSKPHSDFGKLQNSYEFTEKGLEFTANVISNPKLIWKGGDLVSVTLQPAYLNVALGNLMMYDDANAVTITAKFTFEDIARLAKVDLSGKTKGAEKREALAIKMPQMGVLATWRTEDGKGEQHRSGGMDQKGGSGLINIISKVSEDTLRETETMGFAGSGIRNIGWNEGEMMKPGRPIYDKFPNLFQLEKEMATTLEAESEYMLNVGQFEKVLSDMQRLAGMSLEELLSAYAIVKKPTSETKIYTDTYYDLGGTTDKKKLPLLESDIVLRRRSVTTDPKGTNLIAVKGRTHKSSDDSEAIRLAAQINAQYDFLDEDKQEEIREFLRTESDNAFGRVLRDALKGKGREDLLEEDFTMKKALTIRSERTKYKLWLANSTMIDFSADKAFGSTDEIPEDPRNVVYSFEFGVGHPGLAATSSSTGELAEEDPQLEQIKAKPESALKTQLLSDHLSKRQALVHRPYHVPKDLENQSLFQKDDFKQYQKLRNDIIDKLFSLTRNKLEKGGNKAKVLATMMGLMGDVD